MCMTRMILSVGSFILHLIGDENITNFPNQFGQYHPCLRQLKICQKVVALLNFLELRSPPKGQEVIRVQMVETEMQSLQLLNFWED
jgi:hypothetical protein